MDAHDGRFDEHRHPLERAVATAAKIGCRPIDMEQEIPGKGMVICSTELRENDGSAKAGDPDLRADRNEGQQEGSDQLRVANQPIGGGLVQDGGGDKCQLEPG